MEKDLNNISIYKFFVNNNRFTKYFRLAMIAILAIIAIILIDLNIKNGKNQNIINQKIISLKHNSNEKIYKFITEYFAARTNLNYTKIFAAYGRDYYKEERESKNNLFKKTIDNIRYERIFVKSYDNINIYTEKGLNEGEEICIVSYDMSFGFTTDKAPMLALFYLVEDGDSYIIKDDFDVGTSKYIVDVVSTDFVKDLYSDTVTKLNRVLQGNESLKLAYNSFRQSEMNMKSDLGPLNKKEIIDSIINNNKYDLIEDADEIYKVISNKKKEEIKQKELNDYLKKVIASLSDAQRMN